MLRTLFCNEAMLYKITNDARRGLGPIRILYPGAAISALDSGIGSIGRIDHAMFKGKQTIKMHPHVNDEILSYFREGTVEHLDSEGYRDTVGGKRLMLMKAGKLFYHEEYIDGQTTPFEGLQIFMRPGKKDLMPEVIFHNLDELHSKNKWRLVASPTQETPLQFSSESWVYDVNLSEAELALPALPKKGLTGLLYVYQGAVEVNKNIKLQKQESLVIKDEEIAIYASSHAELVLFLTDEQATIFKNGMFSGNTFTSN